MRLLSIPIFIFSFITVVALVQADVEKIQATPDIRFILQTRAGMSAYATITDTISLEYVRPMFSEVEIENEEYILGDYLLQGRNDEVKLAVGSTGWAIAYHTKEIQSQRLFDCPSFNVAHPSIVTNRPEKAIIEVAAALGEADPALGFFDFRYPSADSIILHWLFIPNNGAQESTINLLLDNVYFERGYAFCTVLTNSKLWLNGQIIDQEKYTVKATFRWGLLGQNQLRAGQTNSMKIEAISLFGNGFLGGISSVYSGGAAILTSGGYRQELALNYPIMLGDPVPIYRVNLPILEK